MNNPLKQGLKLVPSNISVDIVLCNNEQSIKTRIKTYCCIYYCILEYVTMNNPLKQGLKLFCKNPSLRASSSNNEQSIKTRIKTPQ